MDTQPPQEQPTARYYENVFILRQELSTSQVTEATENLSALLTDQGATLRHQEYWGLRNLAYPIKKNRKGHYTLLRFEAPPGALTELEHRLRFNEDVLRSLTTEIDEISTEPSAMMEVRGQRDGRRRDERRPGGGHPPRRPHAESTRPHAESSRLPAESTPPSAEATPPAESTTPPSAESTPPSETTAK